MGTDKGPLEGDYPALGAQSVNHNLPRLGSLGRLFDANCQQHLIQFGELFVQTMSKQ